MALADRDFFPFLVSQLAFGHLFHGTRNGVQVIGISGKSIPTVPEENVSGLSFFSLLSLCSIFFTHPKWQAGKKVEAHYYLFAYIIINSIKMVKMGYDGVGVEY